MNSVSLLGRITKDPEVRYTSGEKSMAVAKFTVAVDDGWGEKKRTNFIPVTVFGKSAENCERYLHKGDRVAATGKIQTGSYEKDGRKVYTTDVIADRVEFFFESAEGKKDIPKGYESLDEDSGIPF